MRLADVKAPTDVNLLFGSLIEELNAKEFLLAFGSEGPTGPYVQILSRPERRPLEVGITPHNRTTVRLQPYTSYLAFLESSFPRLGRAIAEACREDRPFLVIESWLRYVALGRCLLDFARAHGLNVRVLDYAGGESRLNGVRIRYDEAVHQWRAEEGSVDDLLRDPRKRRRTLLARLDFRWRLKRLAARLSLRQRREIAGPATS